MAKVTEYSRITKMKDNDILLVDGPDGTRTILQTDAAKELGSQVVKITKVSGESKVAVNTTGEDVELATMADLEPVEEDVGELKTQTENLYIDGDIITSENEIILTDNAYIKNAVISGANEVTVRNAQLFEANYGGTSSYGVVITNNQDGTFTINGTATSSAEFHLNKTTRMGTDDPFALSLGKYSLSVEILSGTISKNTATSGSFLVFSVFEAGTNPTLSELRRLYGEDGDFDGIDTEDNFELTNTIIGIRLTNGVIYNNVRFRMMVNKGDPLPWVLYKTPETVTSPFADLAEKINDFNPLAWIIAQNGTISLTTQQTPEEYTDAKISELKDYVDDEIDNLYVDGTVTAENEVILSNSPSITDAQITGSNECTVRNAQIFEALYPGTSNQFGVQVTKNDDDSYTINGVATSAAGFNLNKSTRTGTGNPFALPNGKYSLTAEIVSGTIEKNTATADSLFYIGVFDDGITTISTTPMHRIFKYNEEYTPTITLDNFETENTLIGIRLTSGVQYNNVRVRIMVNKGEPLEWTKYKTPTTVVAPFDDLASIINTYNPLAWIIAESGVITLATGETPKAYTDAKISELKDYVDGKTVNDRFGVIEKYNDRVDALAQLFTKNLLLLIYTDIHGDEINLNRINTWKAGNKPAYVDDSYCLGDMVVANFSDAESDIAKFNTIPIWGPTLKIIGNHDVSVEEGVGPTVTANQAYNMYIAPYVSGWNVIQPANASTDGKNYYYKDYIKHQGEENESRIRVIAIDTYYYTTDQHNWFVATLESARTNGFSVIVMQHEDICTKIEKHPLNADYPFASKHYYDYGNLQYRTYGDGGNYQTKRNAVDNFIANGGSFICWLSGHTHADMSGYYEGEHGRQLSVVLSNASKSMTSNIRIDDYCQDCFTYLAVDTESKYVYLLRIGVDIDKWYHKNTFLCYDYHKLESGEEEPGANRVIEYN